MATFSTHMMNLMEAYRREGYTNPEEFLGDLMLQNDLLRTAAVAPANKGCYNDTLRAIALGKGGVTMINGGIPDISAKTKRVSDPVIMFEGKSKVDIRIFDGAPDLDAVRNSEDAANLAGFTNSWNEVLIYGDPKTANGYEGLATRRNKLSMPNVVSLGGTDNLSSGYLIEWGNLGTRLLYAKNTAPGISSVDRGMVEADAQDGTGKFWAFERDYKITFGLSVRSENALWRFANIDALEGDISAILAAIIKAKNKMPGKGRTGYFYCNSDIKSLFEILLLDKATNIKTVDIEGYGPITQFLQIPIMDMDSISSDEAAVA